MLQEALSLGADFSELYVEDTEENTVSMTDGRIEDAGYTRKKGAGIRAAKGPLQAYVYTADLASMSSGSPAIFWVPNTMSTQENLLLISSTTLGC